MKPKVVRAQNVTLDLSKSLKGTEELKSLRHQQKSTLQREVKELKKARKDGGKAVTQRVEVVARSLAVPLSYVPVRAATTYTELLTALANPWRVDDAKWDKTNTTAQARAVLAPEYLFAAQFRDPVRNTIVYDANTAGTGYAYDVIFNNAGDLTTTLALTKEGGPLDFVYLKTKDEETFKPHGDYLFPGLDDRRVKYFWLDGTADTTTTGRIWIEPSTPVTGIFEIYNVNDPNEMAGSAVFSASSASQAVTVSKPGYYRLILVPNSTNAGNCSFYIEGFGSVFCHRPLANFIENVASTDGIRINACSLMYSNMASIANIQGQVAMYQSPGSEEWTKFALSTKGPYTKVSGSNGADHRIAQNGIYGFLKPQNISDFFFSKHIVTDDNGITHCSFDIISEYPYLVFAASITDPNGRNGYFTTCSAIEYQTDDVWRSIALPNLKKGEFEEAIEVVGELVQFHDNPLHFSDLWNQIKKVAPKLIEGAAEMAVSKAIQMLA